MSIISDDSVYNKSDRRGTCRKQREFIKTLDPHRRAEKDRR